MDTRQLATFCAVVERESFSQAAERLGVTQPAVSLQCGPRGAPGAEAARPLGAAGRAHGGGRRLYRSAQRILQLEEQLLEDVAALEDGELGGTLALGASISLAHRPAAALRVPA